MSSNKFCAVAAVVAAACVTYLVYFYIAEGRIHSRRFDIIMMNDPGLFWICISAGAAFVPICLVIAVAFWRLVDPPTKQ